MGTIQDAEHAANLPRPRIAEPGRRANADTAPVRQAWRAVSPDGWIWAGWDERYSLFHAETGDTHLLTDLAAMLLETTVDGPRTTEWLCNNAAALCSVPADNAWSSRIEALIESLEEIDLIERVSG
jgi:PqqD family protein of HPr-rel-A system